MPAEFHAMAGAEGWQLSNPPIMALAVLRASMDIFQEAGMEQLQTKSLMLTGYLEFLLRQLNSKTFSVITPREPGSQGGADFFAGSGQGTRWLEAGGRRDSSGLGASRIFLAVAPIPLHDSFRMSIGLSKGSLRSRGSALTSAVLRREIPRYA